MNFAVGWLLLSSAMTGAPSCQEELRLLAPQMEGEVARFYEYMGYECAWTQAGAPTPQAMYLTRVFAQAASKGLDARDYQTAAVAGAGAGQTDLAVTQAAVRYVSDLCGGRVNPRTNRCDVVGTVTRLVNAPDAAGVLQSAEPPFAGYRRTLRALGEYRLMAQAPEPANLLETEKAIEPGEAYSAAPRLAAHLRRLGDLPAEAALAPDLQVYEGPLVEAVKRFQERHGLEADGQIGTRTVRQLNAPMTSRVRQLELALERWRGVGQAPEGRSIEVNIPEFRLRAIGAGEARELEMNVVVGAAARHKTPTFTAMLRAVVFHPYWNVPWSIQRKELIPEIEKDPGYLAEHYFEVVTTQNEVVPSEIGAGEILAGLRAGTYFLRQTPGAHNALGSVMFRLPNEYSVFMHDTPQRNLFVRARRDFSHGCIRLEKPRELLDWVLQGDAQWPPERIEEAMQGEETTQVALERAIPVSVVYRTVVTEADGPPHFLPDIYGWDARLGQQLNDLSRPALAPGAHASAAEPR